jgi:hypothetical protein
MVKHGSKIPQSCAKVDQARTAGSGKKSILKKGETWTSFARLHLRKTAIKSYGMVRKNNQLF